MIPVAARAWAYRIFGVVLMGAFVFGLVNEEQLISIVSAIGVIGNGLAGVNTPFRETAEHVDIGDDGKNATPIRLADSDS